MLGRVFLGRYQTVRLLGQGGMGRVYLARQLDLNRQVVVKVMHDHLATDPKFCERFQREMQLMARFQHPYAVSLYDASLNEVQGPCIIMEYVRGVTLHKLLENNQGRLSPGRVGRLLSQLCEVLQMAHQEGIIHRDLKPSNLMVVDPDSPYEKIKVMDFGLAKLVDPPNLVDAHVSGADFAVGTPTYICPEQIRGDPLDHRSDLYSVGVMLYELLTGRTPYGVSSTMDILLAHATEEPLPLTRAGDEVPIPPAVEAVVLSCLAKNPADRPVSALELARRFQEALEAEGDGVPVLADSVPVLEEPPPPTVPAAPEQDIDPAAIVYSMIAWMPESIAVHKLRGFLEDVGGEVVESIPGHVRVQLGGPESIYHLENGRSLWFRRQRRSGLIEIDLRMEYTDPERPNQLQITAAFRSLDEQTYFDAAWRAHIARIFCDVRAYLMGRTGAAKDATV